MTATNPLVSIVVPFYNESEGVEYFRRSIDAAIRANAAYRFEIVCIDDGSRDDTLSRLVAIAQSDANYRIIELSRNFGKEAALTAGIDAATGDVVIPLDADLQDPPELIERMLEAWRQGADVVLAKRSNRAVDSLLKRKTAGWFYRFHNQLSSVELPENVGDFRLMNRAAVNALKQLPERQRFMKGLFAWIGFKTTTIEYTRQVRSAGNSKFSFWKLWNLALDGITSFSTVPLRVWTYVGMVIAALSLLYAGFIVIRTIINGVDVPGYASLLVAILFLGGLQLMSIGVLGEYIGRIFIESKHRPSYLIRKIYERDRSSVTSDTKRSTTQ